MKVYNVSELALKNEGEYMLGSAELYTHACYFIYGILNQGEKGRVIKPGKGHEEIVYLIQGEALLRRETETFSLKQGQAFHVKGEESCLMDNNGRSDVVYVIVGGHSEEGLHTKV